ncbi:MAG: DNA repair protein RecO [Collinsella sp.]
MAGSRTYRTKVLVLDKTKLKETDLILTMLDERGRQVRAVAKGARKPGGRLAARCELFCTVDMLLAHGRSLDVVSQAELLEAQLGAAPDYDTTCASAIAEVARVCFGQRMLRIHLPLPLAAGLTLVGSGSTRHI